MKKKLKSNIWKYTIHLITNKRTYMTILGVYLLTLPESTPNTLGLLLLIGNFTNFIFEIPSGYISDKIGHKKALIIGRTLLLFSTFFYFLGINLFTFILGAIFLSIGHSFISGTGVAFMHETLSELKMDKKYSQIMGKMNSIGFAVPIIFIFTIPFLTNINFRVAFIIPLILDVIGLLAIISLYQPQKSQYDIEELTTTNFKDILKESIQLKFLPYCFLLALIAGSISSASNFKSIYQEFLNVPIIYYGIFWGLSRVLVSLLLLTNYKIKTRISFHQFLKLKIIFAIILISSLYFIQTPYLVVIIFIFIAAFNWSFREVKNHFILEIINKSKFKATLLSIITLLTSIIIGAFSFIIGYLSTLYSYPISFLTISILLLSLSLLNSIWIFKSNQSSNLPY